MDSCGSLAGSLLDLAGAVFAAGSAWVCGGRGREEVQLGGRRYQVVRPLGEGGFSQVLLVEEAHSGQQYALKKIVCHQGTDALAMAQREIDAGQRFRHPNIVPLVDHAVVEGGPELRGTQIAYLVFPVYRHGSMFDAVMDRDGAGLDELTAVRVFRGVCAAVSYLHAYRGAARAPGAGGAAGDRPSLASVDLEEEDSPQPPRPGRASGYAELPQADGGEGGAARGALAPPGAGGGYAHRDIKLGNVMLGDDGATPILMDFGSVRA
ncbi:Serine/threonine-protein kinase env7, partial [Coemansia nantahalensis]